MDLIIIKCPSLSVAVSEFREFINKYSRYVVKAHRDSLEVILVRNTKVKFVVDNEKNLLGLRGEFMYIDEFAERYMDGHLYD